MLLPDSQGFTGGRAELRRKQKSPRAVDLISQDFLFKTGGILRGLNFCCTENCSISLWRHIKRLGQLHYFYLLLCLLAIYIQ